MRETTYELVFEDNTGIHTIKATNEYKPLNVLTTIAIALKANGSAKSVRIIEIIPDGEGVHIKYHEL